MATQYGHAVAFNESLNSARDAHRLSDGIVLHSLVWLRQFYCRLHGHDLLMQFGSERLFLQCASCGHESPGWELTETPPRIVLRGDARRHAIVRPHLVGAERRIA
jgi:hypothetical protein